MEVASRGGVRVPTDDWNDRDTTWRRALGDFQSAARAELGVTPEIPGFSPLATQRFRSSPSA